MLRIQFPEISNRETWSETLELSENGASLPDLASCKFSFAMRMQGTQAPIITGTEADLLTVDGQAGTLSWNIDARQLQPGYYDVGATVERSERFEQILVGTIEVIDGVVP